MAQNENLQLPFFYELRGPDAVAAGVIEAFGDDEKNAMTAAVAWAWDARRVRAMTKAVAAVRCGITRQHFGAILAGRKYLPPHSINQFEWVMGNTAVSQTMRRFADLREKRAVQEIAQLVAQHIGRAA